MKNVPVSITLAFQFHQNKNVDRSPSRERCAPCGWYTGGNIRFIHPEHCHRIRCFTFPRIRLLPQYFIFLEFQTQTKKNRIHPVKSISSTSSSISSGPAAAVVVVIVAVVLNGGYLPLLSLFFSFCLLFPPSLPPFLFFFL